MLGGRARAASITFRLMPRSLLMATLSVSSCQVLIRRRTLSRNSSKRSSLLFTDRMFNNPAVSGQTGGLAWRSILGCTSEDGIQFLHRSVSAFRRRRDDITEIGLCNRWPALHPRPFSAEEVGEKVAEPHARRFRWTTACRGPMVEKLVARVGENHHCRGAETASTKM